MRGGTGIPWPGPTSVLHVLAVHLLPGIGQQRKRDGDGDRRGCADGDGCRGCAAWPLAWMPGAHVIDSRSEFAELGIAVPARARDRWRAGDEKIGGHLIVDVAADRDHASIAKRQRR